MAAGISYSLTIDGAAASSALLQAIRQIDVEDHAELADMLRLRLAVGVRAARVWPGGPGRRVQSVVADGWRSAA